MLPARDVDLLQILDNSLADASRRAQKPDGTSWLACRPGCTSCCHGVFKISMLDRERLRAGLQELQQHDPARARAIRERADDLVAALSPVFPGDPATGLLSTADDSAWDTFADLPETDVPCPVLNTATGRCELYAHRPLTCRVFGPPVLNEMGLGVCELCYIGASDAEIAQGEMTLAHTGLEAELEHHLPEGASVIAWSLLL